MLCLKAHSYNIKKSFGGYGGDTCNPHTCQEFKTSLSYMRPRFKNQNLLSEAKEIESLDDKHADRNSMLEITAEEGRPTVNKTHALSGDPSSALSTHSVGSQLPAS